jgi:hypothetical protein
MGYIRDNMCVGRSLSKGSWIGLLAVVGALVAFGLGSCQLLGVTKMDRLTQFGYDLNNLDKSHMSGNFAQGQTADYGIMDSQVYWDGKSFVMPGATELPYSLTVHDYVDPANVTVDIYGPPAFILTVDPIPAVFVLVQVGPDWFIKEIYLNGSGTPTVQ